VGLATGGSLKFEKRRIVAVVLARDWCCQR
jgi:hypothetical protein